MNPTEQLRDIDGLYAVSPFPLATGWWIVIGLSLLIILAAWLGWQAYRRRYRPPVWIKAATQQWQDLAQQSLTPQEQVIALQQLLRITAIKKYGRTACAGLSGEAWLTWLTDHDPNKVNWHDYHAFLLELPYHVTEENTPNTAELQQLATAVYAWIEEGELKKDV